MKKRIILILTIIILTIAMVLVLAGCGKNNNSEDTEVISQSGTTENTKGVPQKVKNSEAKDFANNVTEYIETDNIETIVNSIDFNGFYAYLMSTGEISCLSGDNNQVTLNNKNADYDTLISYLDSLDNNSLEQTKELYGEKIYSSSDEFGINFEMDGIKYYKDLAIERLKDAIKYEIESNYVQKVEIKKISNSSKTNIGEYVYACDVDAEITYMREGETKVYSGSNTVYISNYGGQYSIIYADWLKDICTRNNIAFYSAEE